MSHHLQPDEIKKRLWDETDKAHIGMLGLVGGQPHHMQPMATFVDRDDNALWFFTKTTSDLVRDTGAGHQAMLCVMAKDMEFQACIGGELTPDKDRAKIEKFWNANVSAWYPDGKDDPELTLLRLTPKDAQVWIMRGGPLNYGFQVIKANATHTTPDVGDGAAEVRLS
jgi:general stress protein 26